MNTCVILNPHAGSAIEERELRAQLERFDGVQLRTTQHPGHGKALARAAVEQGCTLMIAAGGDGTINEVLNGIAPDFDGVQLGIIPLGTGNDLVRTLHIPYDVQAAVETLLDGRTRMLDVVRVSSDEDRYFLNVSSGGFSGLVDEKLTEDMKKAWGPLAYLRSALEVLPDLADYHTEITLDDEEPLVLTTYNLVLANARYVAGGIPIAPEAEPDDGLLDVIIVPAASLPQLAALAPQILRGTHLDSDLIMFRRAGKVRVDSRPGMWFNVDGELVGNEPSVFEVLPRRLQVIVGTEIDTTEA
jgi:diacylglycerol kinase (ATP)